MPFDGKLLPQTPAERRRILIDALRSPMPDGFVWDYGSYRTCAVGLMKRLGFFNSLGNTYHYMDAMEPLGLSFEQAIACFSSAGRHEPSPHQVADRLERIHQEIGA